MTRSPHTVELDKEELPGLAAAAADGYATAVHHLVAADLTDVHG